MKYLFFILYLIPFISIAQVRIDPEGGNSELKGIIYKNEYSVEFKMHTFGMSAGFNKGKQSTYYKTSFYHFDIGF